MLWPSVRVASSPRSICISLQCKSRGAQEDEEALRKREGREKMKMAVVKTRKRHSCTLSEISRSTSGQGRQSKQTEAAVNWLRDSMVKPGERGRETRAR